MEWSECISKAVSYIEDHITEELTIKDISKEAMVSPYYFQKGFAMLCGFTVGEYIKKRRLAIAGMELISTDRKIIDIALQYGYDSPDGFTRAFPAKRERISAIPTVNHTSAPLETIEIPHTQAGMNTNPRSILSSTDSFVLFVE